MATLQTIKFSAERPVVAGNQISWSPSLPGKSITQLPQLFWANGDPWREANLWAFMEAASERKHIKSVKFAMSGLLTYAKWLEHEQLTWWHFPALEKDRCLNRYRGYLVRKRERGEMSPSTVSARMATAIRFYRWLKQHNLISAQPQMWVDRHVGVKVKDTFGFDHTIRLLSTNLAIPNRRVSGGLHVEDGLLPVTQTAMREILNFAEQKASPEIALMLRLGFGTGLRVGSISDLKVENLLHAPKINGLWRWINVGPGARPPVNTKFGVYGSVLISEDLLQHTLAYATSARRLKRRAMAKSHHRDHLFLTRYGDIYGHEASRAINVEMGRLRKAGAMAGITVLDGFKFHRSRATFITELMRAALQFMNPSEAVNFVRRAALHKNDQTTLKYVTFLERSSAMEAAAEEFTRVFLGRS